MDRRRAFALAAGLTIALAAASPGVGDGFSSRSKKLHQGSHIVVVYQENHSSDTLFGGWEGVNGLAGADAIHTPQVTQAGVPYTCLKQNDVKLTSPSPLPTTCVDNTTASPFVSAFPNQPFRIDDYVAPSDSSCPLLGGPSGPPGVAKGAGRPGGCIEDLVHRFYQEQYQLDGGKQDRYTTGSDAIGLTQGYYDTPQLPLYKYLQEPAHPRYAIADDFFQSAFGGSFLNHQWLIAAATPTFPNPPAGLRSVIDSNGMV